MKINFTKNKFIFCTFFIGLLLISLFVFLKLSGFNLENEISTKSRYRQLYENNKNTFAKLTDNLLSEKTDFQITGTNKNKIEVFRDDKFISFNDFEINDSLKKIIYDAIIYYKICTIDKIGREVKFGFISPKEQSANYCILYSEKIDRNIPYLYEYLDYNYYLVKEPKI